MGGRVFRKLVTGVMILLIGMAVLSFLGCEQAAPPQPKIQPKIQKNTPPPPEQEVVEEKPEEEGFNYDPSGRREPFKTLIAEEIPKVDEVVIPTPDVIETPLQKFSLDELKITGIILGGLGDYARIEAPDGKSYTINIGTLMGNQEGKVTNISEDAVTVKETVRHESGKVEEVETPLYLNPIKEVK